MTIEIAGTAHVQLTVNDLQRAVHGWRQVGALRGSRRHPARGQFRAGEGLARGRISFEAAEQFVWDHAMIAEDLRKKFGERRFQALGFIAGRLNAMVSTPRGGRVAAGEGR
jgi:hypothetical protein